MARQPVCVLPPANRATTSVLGTTALSEDWCDHGPGSYRRELGAIAKACNHQCARVITVAFARLAGDLPAAIFRHLCRRGRCEGLTTLDCRRHRAWQPSAFELTQAPACGVGPGAIRLCPLGLTGLISGDVPNAECIFWILVAHARKPRW